MMTRALRLAFAVVLRERLSRKWICCWPRDSYSCHCGFLFLFFVGAAVSPWA